MSDRIEAEILDVLGEEVAAAVDTPLVVIEGPKGDPGKDGITPTIGPNGNWYLGSTDTGKPSRGATGAPGKDGHSPVVTATKSGKTTTISVDGAAIATVEDGADGSPVNWRGAWEEDTEYRKLDAVSYDGSSYIFTSDTHVIGSIPGVDEEWGLMAQKGNDGANGVTPHIGDNGHWYLGATDTGKPSRGATGAPGKDGNQGAPGKDGAPGIYYGTTPPTGDTHPVWIDPDGGPDDGGLLPAVTDADNGKFLRVVSSAWAAADMPTGGTDMGITGATVGQIAKITAVDDTGKPTAWEAVDLPSGGGGSGETWEEINAITLSDAVNTVTINTDSGGNTIALKKVRILFEGSATHNQDLFFNNFRYFRAPIVGTEASVGAFSAEPFCGKMYCFAVVKIIANYEFNNQIAAVFSDEITITEIKLIVNNSGTFSAGTKFTIQGVRA